MKKKLSVGLVMFSFDECGGFVLFDERASHVFSEEIESRQELAASSTRFLKEGIESAVRACVKHGMRMHFFVATRGLLYADGIIPQVRPHPYAEGAFIQVRICGDAIYLDELYEDGEVFATWDACDNATPIDLRHEAQKIANQFGIGVGLDEVFFDTVEIMAWMGISD
ncbi:MAG: hypothetical protein ACD_76C00027G0002 [uncultured bacterium]|nr:MAG: hypothetical protein ACD_76C00027G0002 [uncultured bacterium]HBD05228.1 hypothetical protein [Candidatus Uhrbacteria bacterium]